MRTPADIDFTFQPALRWARSGGGPGSPPAPRLHCEHPGEQQSAAAVRRPGAGAPGGSCEEEPRTRAAYLSGDAPVKRHAHRPRISGRSARFVRARRTHPGTHPPPPIRSDPLQIPSAHSSAGIKSRPKVGHFRSPLTLTGRLAPPDCRLGAVTEPTDTLLQRAGISVQHYATPLPRGKARRWRPGGVQ